MDLSPGQQLRQARELRGLSLAQAAHTTRIRLSYLAALESDQMEQLPSPAQGRGLMRAYAQYLQLDPDQLILAKTGKEEAGQTLPAEIPVASPATNQAQLIFREIGDKLRRQREAIGLSLEDVERQTHLRIVFLKAIEGGQIDNLPSSVQGRGMISNYAAFLGFDPDPILLRFADGLQARLAARKGPRISLPEKPTPGRARLFSADFWLTAIIIISLVVFIGWAILRVADINSQQGVEPTAPSVAEVLAPNEPSPTATSSLATPAGPTSAETPTPGPLQIEVTAAIEPVATEIQPPINQSPVQVYVAVHQRAWMRVTVDGKIAFEGRVIPGVAYVYSGNERIAVLTGNGAALQLFFNRNDLGLMGILGEVVERVFTPSGVVTPTPTPTLEGLPSLTPTTAATTTPTPTPTLRP